MVQLKRLGVHLIPPTLLSGFLGGSVVKNPPANAGDSGLIPESESSPEGGPCDLLQYCCLGNPMNRGAWQARVHGGRKESDMTERLNNNTSFQLQLSVKK